MSSSNMNIAGDWDTASYFDARSDHPVKWPLLCMEPNTGIIAQESVIASLLSLFASWWPHIRHVVFIILYNPWDCVKSMPVLLWRICERLPPLLHWILILSLVYRIYNMISSILDDYQAYLDLGKGGTPANWFGWCRITYLRCIGRIKDVLEPPHIPPMLEPYRGTLEVGVLPQRQGERPKVGGVAPQRQTNHKAPQKTFNQLSNLMYNYAMKHHRDLIFRTSFLEGHTEGLSARPSRLTDKRPATVLFGREICHPHRVDGSLHMVMHPEDIGTVIEAGWGERHPLARADWYWRLWFQIVHCGSRPPVPETLVFVYAPRNEEEIAVVAKLLQAATWWICGKSLDIDLDFTPIPSLKERKARKKKLQAGLRKDRQEERERRKVSRKKNFENNTFGVIDDEMGTEWETDGESAVEDQRTRLRRNNSTSICGSDPVPTRHKK